MKIKMMELFKKAFDLNVDGEMRYGQSLMNALAHIDPEIYRHVTDGNLTPQSIDPFYDDKNVERFLNYLDEVWG